MFAAPSPAQVTAVILAGGRGARMGGADKGLVELAGRPMVVHVLDKLQRQVDAVLLNANRHATQYRALGVPVIADTMQGYAGPLAGVASALAAIDTPWLLCVPCDAPRLPDDLLAHFCRAAEVQTAPLYVIRTGEGVQPVFCLIHCSLGEHLERYLDSGGRTMRAWQQQAGAIEVSYPGRDEAFANINTPEALAAVAAALGAPDPKHTHD